MKKFAMAAVAAAAMTAGVAQAYTSGTFTNGVVVPNVIHNGATDTTAVGVISNGASSVFWTFFDQNSNHVTDGCFGVTNNQFKGFTWADPTISGAKTAGVRGYLVLAASPNGCADSAAAEANVTAGTAATAKIAVNAFQVDVASKDVAFAPVIDGPLTVDFTKGTITTMGPDSLTAVGGAAQVAAATTATFNMRYYIDGAAGGTDTRIVVWSTGNQKRSHTVDMYDNAQNRKSVNFILGNAELDWFDPETIVGRPATFTDGFIEWNATAASFAPATAASVYTYSVMVAPAFGAVQTVLGAHR